MADQLNFADVVRDPTFYTLDPSQRFALLRKISPDRFGALSPERQAQYMLSIESQYSPKANAPQMSQDKSAFGPSPVGLGGLSPLSPLLEKVTQSDFRKATATLPWIGGAAGGMLGAPGDLPSGGLTSIGLAALGGGAGSALEKLLNLAVTDSPQTQTSAGNAAGIAKDAATQALWETGAKVLTPAMRVASPAIKESAAKSLEEALGATRETMKQVATEKVVPGMLDREIMASSRKGLSRMASEAASDVGSKIDQVVAASTATGKQLDTEPIIQSLENAKSAFMLKNPTGGLAAARPEAIAKITEIQNGLKTYGNQITPTDLVNFRRFFDEEVALGRKAFLVDPSKGFNQRAQEAAVNSIRDTLNKEVPDLGTLNAQYSFWRNLQTVMDATLQRTASQTGVVGKGMAVLRGGGAGAAIGGALGGPTGAAMGGFAGTALGELTQSTAWRTVSAVNKNRLAGFLARGDVASANAMAARLAGGTVAAATQE